MSLPASLPRLPLTVMLAAALALSACSSEPEPSTPAAATDSSADGAAIDSAPAEPAPAPVPDPAELLETMLKNPARSPENVARDAYRHPRETLSFFGLHPTQTVIEITPGAGWYTEILAPYLRSHGHYIAATIAPGSAPMGNVRAPLEQANKTFHAKLMGDPSAYDQAAVVKFDRAAPVFGPPESADLVLTFRNVHNWRTQPMSPQGMFSAFHAVLKPGGILGVVEHRADADVAEGDKSGYLSENQVIALATAAGFLLEEKSEINANPKDTKDHPRGVWTLPPTLNVPAGEDVQKYKDIGESDRMTLRFVKPATTP